MAALTSAAPYPLRQLLRGPSEIDPGFRQDIRALTQRGMTVAPLLATASVLIFMISYALGDKPIAWNYGVPRSIVLWDELLILAFSVAVLVIARKPWAPAWGRLIMSILIILISVATIVEDVARGDATSSTAVLSLALIVAVGTVPFRAEQTLALGLSVTAAYIVIAYIVPAAKNVQIEGFDTFRTVYMIVLTCLLSGISALLYQSRYDQYRALRDLRVTQAQLIHAEKMASLVHLTAGIAHEIKNPLNFINNFAEINVQLTEELAEMLVPPDASDSHEDPDRLESILTFLRVNNEKIDEHGKRADAIVRSMMLHARGVSGERRRIHANAFVEEYVDLALKSTRSQLPGVVLDVEREYAHDVGDIDVVPQEVGRVLINLLSNAIDAVLEVQSTNGHRVPLIRITTRRVGEHIEIRIGDNGYGIPAAVLPRIFEPFFTTKPAGKGTGLGLSISYDVIVHGHDGHIHVENNEGQGATFVITLPAASATPAATNR